MKGWYVIWTEGVEDFSGRGCKARALKRAKEIYNSGLDDQVFIQHYNDENKSGYFAGEETIFINSLC